MSAQIQADVVIIATGEHIGKNHHLFVSNGLGVEDYKEEHSAVINIPGRGNQGIESRLKIIFVMQNGDVKVDVYIQISK